DDRDRGNHRDGGLGGVPAMMSKFFIEHPVLANVLAIVLVIIGCVSLMRLPTAQYPNITPPTVLVTTRYPGASPQTVVDTIALPIELQVNGVPGMIYMQSKLARLPGVGNVTVMGAGEYSMRIWMDPQKLYSFGLVPADVIRVVRQQSQEVAAGQVGMPPA